MAHSKRNWVWFDRFAMFQVSREHRLTTPEYVVLHCLTMVVDYKTREWSGTLLELAQEVPPTTATLLKAVVSLEKRGLVTLVEPFGRNGRGTVRVDCYDELVVPRATLATATSRSAKALGSPPSSPEHRQERRYDQGDLPRSRDRGEREGGSSSLGESKTYLCQDCGRPSFGAPFGENCRCPF
jgi:hypothetical protein